MHSLLDEFKTGGLDFFSGCNAAAPVWLGRAEPIIEAPVPQPPKGILDELFFVRVMTDGLQGIVSLGL